MYLDWIGSESLQKRIGNAMLLRKCAVSFYDSLAGVKCWRAAESIFGAEK